MAKVDLDALIRRLVEAYQPQRVILYGSRAYGEPRADSDVDLLVIKETDEEWWQRKSTVSRCLRGVTTAWVDVRVITPAELAGRLERGNQFYAEVLERGRVVYGPPLGEVPSVAGKEGLYAQDWLATAKRDLGRSDFLASETDGDGAGFHLHQALEKCLQAFLIAEGWPLRRTRSLAELIREAEERAPGFIAYLPLVNAMGTWYRAGRAGSKEQPPTREEVRRAREEAQPLIERVRGTVLGPGT